MSTQRWFPPLAPAIRHRFSAKKVWISQTKKRGGIRLTHVNMQVLGIGGISGRKFFTGYPALLPDVRHPSPGPKKQIRPIRQNVYGSQCMLFEYGTDLYSYFLLSGHNVRTQRDRHIHPHVFIYKCIQTCLFVVTLHSHTFVYLHRVTMIVVQGHTIKTVFEKKDLRGE